MARPMLVGCAAIAALLATRHEALSQAPRVQIAVGAGMATDARGTTSHAATIAPSLSWGADPRLSFGVGGSATRFANEQWSLGGSGSATARVPLGALAALTFDGAGTATATSYDAAYQTADAIPALELHAGPVAAFVGAHAAYGRSSLLSQATTPFGAIPGTTRDTAASRTAFGPVFGGDAHLADANESLIFGYREEHASVDRIAWADRTASASVANGALTIAGSIGARSAPDEHTTFGSGSMSIALPGAIALELAAGTYPSNRVTGLPAGRYATVGFSLHVGAPPAVAPPAPGFTRLALRADDATRVEVAGDWSHWSLVPARRAPDGTWYVDLKLTPGQYRYAFRVNGTAWRIPDGAAAVDDEYGGKSAWLTVRGQGTTGSHDTMEER